MPATTPHRYSSSTCGGVVAVPNRHSCSEISAIWATTADLGNNDGEGSTTQLDSHANMVVVGQQATVFGRSGKSADVRPFSSDCSKLESVPIVDAAVAYDCPYLMKTYLLSIRNALYVPSMTHNLIPPFIMREAGLVVNDVPRIHTKSEELTNETHCIVACEGDVGTDLKIPLRLDGIFSCFDTRKLTAQEVNDCEYIETVKLTPESSDWDPYDPQFADQEDSFVDFRGEVLVRPPKKRKVFDDADIADIQVTAEQYEAVVSSIVARNHERLSEGAVQMGCNPLDGDADLSRGEDFMQSAVAELTACFDQDLLCKMANERTAKSKVAMEAGSMSIWDDDSEDELFEEAATHVDTPKGVTAEQLSKVWRISHEDAKKTLDVTSQLNKKDADASLSRRFGTNDRMLRYKRIDAFFYTDTFYAKKVVSKRGYSMI